MEKKSVIANQDLFIQSDICSYTAFHSQHLSVGQLNQVAYYSWLQFTPPSILQNHSITNVELQLTILRTEPIEEFTLYLIPFHLDSTLSSLNQLSNLYESTNKITYQVEKPQENTVLTINLNQWIHSHSILHSETLEILLTLDSSLNNIVDFYSLRSSAGKPLLVYTIEETILQRIVENTPSPVVANESELSVISYSPPELIEASNSHETALTCNEKIFSIPPSIEGTYTKTLSLDPDQEVNLTIQNPCEAAVQTQIECSLNGNDFYPMGNLLQVPPKATLNFPLLVMGSFLRLIITGPCSDHPVSIKISTQQKSSPYS